MTTYRMTYIQRKRNTAARAARYCRINSRSRRRARQRYTFTGNIGYFLLLVASLVFCAWSMAGGW